MACTPFPKTNTLLQISEPPFSYVRSIVKVSLTIAQRQCSKLLLNREIELLLSSAFLYFSSGRGHRQFLESEEKSFCQHLHQRGCLL